MISWLSEHKPYLQQSLGLTVLSVSSFFFIRKVRFAFSAFKNYKEFRQIIDQKINYQSIIAHPQITQKVVVSNLWCQATPELFKTHMRMVGNYQQEAHQQQSYRERSPDFEGEVVQNNQKYHIFCDCKTYLPFVSSSLLCNVISILKKNHKQKVTMMAYGQLTYSSQRKRLQLLGQSFAANQAQLFSAWQFVIGIKSPLDLFLVGLGLGLATCLVWHQQELVSEHFEEVWKWGKQLLQQ